MTADAARALAGGAIGAPHDCVTRINALLAPYNTALATIFSFEAGAPERIALLTEKADAKNRKKPALFFATYCPMCGAKLKDST